MAAVIPIIGVATGIYGAAQGQDQARRGNKERENAKKVVKAREAELAAEAAAKEATRKKAETAGQRAGFGAGAGAGGPSAFASRSTFTGMGAPAGTEDNISRGTLFGN